MPNKVNISRNHVKGYEMAIKPWEQVPLVNGVWRALSDDGIWIGGGTIPAGWFKEAGLNEGTDQLAIVKHIPAKYAKLPTGTPQSVNPLSAVVEIGKALGLTVGQIKAVLEYLEKVKKEGGQLPPGAQPKPGNPNSPIDVCSSTVSAVCTAIVNKADPLLVNDVVMKLNENDNCRVMDGGVISIPMLIMILGATVEILNGVVQASATIYEMFSKQEVLPFMWSEYTWLDGSVTAIYAGWWYGSALKMHHIGWFGPGGEREARIRKWTAELASMKGILEIRRNFPRYPIIAMPRRSIHAVGREGGIDVDVAIESCITEEPVQLPLEAITHRPQLVLGDSPAVV